MDLEQLRAEIASGDPARSMPALARLRGATPEQAEPLLLLGLPLAAGQSHMLAVFEAFYRSGALVFGGGHVVLPLLHDALVAHYTQTNDPKNPSVKVLPPTDDLKLDATALNDTNLMELRVFANEQHGHAVLMARLDNLGKGASGAAVQNLRLMLGV